MAGLLGRCRLQVLWHRCGSLPHDVIPSLTLRHRSRQLSSVGDPNGNAAAAAAVRRQLEAAARENRLDFLTAAKILFSTPPKPKTFGLDFHLWQLFVACLPPLAVYLVAQYARFEIRRMEKEQDDAEQLKLMASMAAEAANESADEENVKKSATVKPGNSLSATQNELELELKRKGDSSVVLPEKDFGTLRARLEVMEERVRLLECEKLRTTPAARRGSGPNTAKDLIKENVERLAAEGAKPQEVGKNLPIDVNT